MSHQNNLLTILLWSLLAGLGGGVRFVANSLKQQSQLVLTRSSVSIYMLKLFANTCISSFSGLMGALLISTLTTNHILHLVAAGSFGYLGVESLDYISNYVKNKFLPPRS